MRERNSENGDIRGNRVSRNGENREMGKIETRGSSENGGNRGEVGEIEKLGNKRNRENGDNRQNGGKCRK